MPQQPQGPSTRAIHAGKQRDNHAITTPIIQSATFSFHDTADLRAFMQARQTGTTDRQEYTRIANPTRTAVERKLAALEGAEAALLFGSGMAALSHLILGSLPTGAHLIMQARCYRGSRQLAERVLARLGIETSFVPFDDPNALEAAIRPKQTRMMIVESPTNPHLRLVDFEQLAELGRRYKVRTVVDSTLATPLNQRPLDYGIDYVVHSATKYLAGHHDVLAGVVMGARARLQALHESQVLLGAISAPQESYLLERGLRTLALRVARHNENAQRIAEYLADHPRITQVWYPGLDTHPDHALARRQMSGYGGIVSFEVAADMDGTSCFIDALTLPYLAPSLGGVETLVEQPALLTYYDLDPAQRAALGISDSLVRLAVGLEDADDLIADIAQALAQLD